VMVRITHGDEVIGLVLVVVPTTPSSHHPV
jgi:hypothetical protein